MVSAQRLALIGSRRRVALFVLVAAWLWWAARRAEAFYVVGLDGAASDALGAILPALSGAATVAMVYGMVENVSRRAVALAGALAVLLLPGFVPVHQESLVGPPALALVVLMTVAMTYAPRFSFAYGGIAAILTVYVTPWAAGTPLAAAGWAWLHARRRGRRAGPRVALALLPLLVVAGAAAVLGVRVVPAPEPARPTGLDAVLDAVGRVIGDQLAPGVEIGSLRLFIIADVALVILAVLALAVRRPIRQWPGEHLGRRTFEAVVLVSLAYLGGVVLLPLMWHGMPLPAVADVMPLAVLGTVATAIAVGVSWPSWSRVAKLACLALVTGWAGTAILFT